MAELFGRDLILLERLAAGGMAEVYRAKKVGRGGFEKTVAVKRILSTFANNEEFKKMFEHEAGFSAMLQHSNVVQIFGHGEFKDYLYIEMEFVDGKNARQLLARAEKMKVKIPISISVFICSEVAKGLHYAHTLHHEKTGEPLGLVHRDISPQNIMISYNGDVKIVDFGIAKVTTSNSETTKVGVLKGKFGYMSPEQAQGMPIDARTDVFALGIVLFELVTQRRLFSSDDDLKTLQLVREAKVPKPSKYNPSVDEALDQIIMKALSKEKAYRYDTAQDMYRDLLKFLNSQHEGFMNSDVAQFFRKLFDSDIKEEKLTRDKHNSEAPALIASREKKSREELAEERTVVSEVRETPKEKTKIDMVEPGVNQLDILPPPQTLTLQKTNQNPISLSNSSHVTARVTPLSVESTTRSAMAAKAPPFPPSVPLSSQKTTITQSAPSSSKLRPLVFAMALVLVVFGVWTYSEEASQNSNSIPVAKVEESPVENSPAPVLPTPIETPKNNVEPKVHRSISSDMTMTLPKTGNLGYVTLKSIPEAAQVYVDGRLLIDEKTGAALLTPLMRIPLPVGRHHLKLQNPAYERAIWESDVDIRESQHLPLEVVLK